MSTTAYEISRNLESLLALCQEALEIGSMGPSTIADALDIAGDLNHQLTVALTEERNG